MGRIWTPWSGRSRKRSAPSGAGALAFLALCWLLIREREAADAERRARDPQGAEARVERRLAADDPAYRLCRRASAAVFALQKEAR